VGLNDGVVFFLSPPFLLDFRVEVVVPAFPALLADPAGQALGDEAPVLGAVFEDEAHDELVFLFGLFRW